MICASFHAVEVKAKALTRRFRGTSAGVMAVRAGALMATNDELTMEIRRMCHNWTAPATMTAARSRFAAALPSCITMMKFLRSTRSAMRPPPREKTMMGMPRARPVSARYAVEPVSSYTTQRSTMRWIWLPMDALTTAT